MVVEVGVVVTGLMMVLQVVEVVELLTMRIEEEVFQELYQMHKD